MSTPLLTIGMAVYRGFHWMVATVQALRMYHDLEDVEILVADNAVEKSPTNYGPVNLVQKWCNEGAGKRLDNGIYTELPCNARYIEAHQVHGTAFPRDRLFREAKGQFVLCIDAHVMLEAGAVARLKEFLRKTGPTKDLYQGPMMYHRQPTDTDLVDEWGDGMLGRWGGMDPRGVDSAADPFEIWAMGLGTFGMWRDNFAGFNPNFRGFGGEEVYLHEKVRQAGGKCWCLPFLRWFHYFRPDNEGIPYRLTVEDKFRNYLIGFEELGWDAGPVIDHFALLLPKSTMATIVKQVYDGEEPKCQKTVRVGTESQPAT